MAPITLAYWDIRGLAQPIRMLLEHTGTEYKEKQYKCGPAPDFDKSCWFEIKETLGFDFPNLPYMIDGDIKITQSNAILRYVGRKTGLDGKTEEDKVRVDMMCDNAMDFRNGFVKLCYNPKFDDYKTDYIKNLPATLKRFSDFLGTRQYFAADYITYPDFHMYEMLYSHKQLASEEVEKFPNLIAFIERIEKLPKIADFLSSDRSPKPMNNKMAKFGFEWSAFFGAIQCLRRQN